MDRKQRALLALGFVALVLGVTVGGLGLLGDRDVVQAAPAARPVQQGVQASGIVTLGQGTCFPDAVLVDCDGNMTHQLKGPGGSGFFAPYYNQWVTLDGAEMTCVVGDKYVQVVNIQAGSNPCPGQGTPSATPPPGATATLTPGPSPGATATPPFPPGVTPTATSVVTGGINLALGKAVQASSAPDAAHPPEHAVDGDANSWWASIPDPQPVWHVRHVQWIYVDLGADYEVEKMRMLWNDQARPRKYAIYTWRETPYRGWDLLAWTERGQADDTVEFPWDVEGRYFMLWLEVPAVAGSNYELREWEVYGPGSTPIQSTNIAAGKASLALSHEAGYEAAKANDADLNTEWRSSTGLPQWIYIDFGSSYEVDRAIVRWVSGLHATSYSLYYWDGFNNWRPLYSTSRGAGGDEVVTFRNTRTRYVLLNATAGPAGKVGLREFEIYEPKSGSGLPPPPPLSSGAWSLTGPGGSAEAKLAPGDTGGVRLSPIGMDDEKAVLRPVPGAQLEAAPNVKAPDPTR